MKTSVALCTFNGEKYLRDQLDSIINQSIKVDEIVICDDCSSDNTINIIKDYQYKNPNLIKLHQNINNLKSVKNFEKAIQLCENDIIFLSDQDDVWKENKVKTITNYFKENKNIDCIASNAECIDKKNININGFSIWDSLSYLNQNRIEYDYLELLLFSGNFATGATMAFRKSLSIDLLPFPIIKNFFHDEWIAIFTAEKGKFNFIDEQLIKYRVHQEQQVGSVIGFKNKLDIYNIFSQNYSKLNFKILKSLLKKAVIFHNDKLIYVKNENTREKIRQLIYNRIELYNKHLKRKYFIRYNFLKLIDFFNGKRKLK